ncbi:MAG: efflux RND transporter periplasmic adaptor subunit [Thermoguttaceae bacterium]
MKTTTWLVISVLVIGLLLAAVFSGWFSSAVPVEGAKVRRGAIREFIDEQAKTRLPVTYLITMPFQGRIEAISLSEGTTVKKDQLVAQIVPRDLQLAVEEAAAAVQRLDASIKENADVKVEESAYSQALQFVRSMRATVKAAFERMKAGKAKFDYAIRDLGRIQQLATTGARTQDDLDQAILQKVQGEVDYQQDQLVYTAMQAMAAATDLMPTMVRQYIERKGLAEGVLAKQKAEAEARLQQVLRDQKRGAIHSPINGVVLNRDITNERFLSAGRTIMEIGRLEDMEIEADILTLDVVAAKVGDQVEIYGPAIGKPVAHGTVDRIFPAGFTKVSSLGVEQQRVKVIIRFNKEDLKRLLKERGLGVGYRVRVRVFTGESSNALIIPRSALFRSPAGGWQVYAISSGTAQIQDVDVGLMNDEQVEIEKGLDEGELVILAPESSLTPGSRVKAAVSEN